VDTARARAFPLAAARRPTLPAVTLAAGALAAALLAGLAVGPVDIGLGSILRSLLARVPGLNVASPLGPVEEAIVWELRAPRVALAALVGATLALAGASYQGVFRNPLADPYLLGVAAGAGLGATAAIVYGGGRAGGYLLPLAAFAGALAAVFLAYAVGSSIGGERTAATLILAGVTVAAFFTALQTFVQQRHSETLNEVYAWLLGGLGTAGWREPALIAPYAVVAGAALLAHRRTLDVLAVGDEEARSLGLDVARARLVIVAAATLGTAAAVAVSGLIGFVGIIVPHLVRLAVSASYRVIAPLSVVVGAAFLVFADLIARTVLAPAELPIGVVTALVGAPFFALVLRTSRGSA
jgi:iron complex transport system permease protein